MITGQSRALANAQTALATTVVVLMALVILLPLLWIVGTSLKPPAEYFSDPPQWIPDPVTFSHYSNVSDFNAGYRSLLNSMVVSTAATLIAVALGTYAAYGLARLGRRGNIWAIWFLSQRILPPVALVVPVFLLMREIDWVNTWQGLIVPYVAINTPFVVWMMRGYFLDIPAAIEESALTEGCSRLSAFRKVVLPISLPGLLSTTVFVFIYCFSEFIIATFLTQTAASVTVPAQLPSFTIANSVLYGEMSALSLTASLPILILGIMTQRYFVRGLTLGAVKN